MVRQRHFPSNHCNSWPATGFKPAQTPTATTHHQPTRISNEPEHESLYITGENTQGNTTERPLKHTSDISKHHRNATEDIQPPRKPPDLTDSESDSVTEQDDNSSNQSHKLLIQWNINGLQNNLGDLQILCNRYNPKCLALQEVNIRPQTDPSTWLGGIYDWKIKRGDTYRQSVGLAVQHDTPHTFLEVDTPLLAVAARIFGTRTVTLVSLYIPHDIQGLEAKLNSLIEQLPPPIIIGGDFNAHHTQWGCGDTNNRGKAVLSSVVHNNCLILNDGSETFRSGRRSSAIDLTVCSIQLAGLSWLTEMDTYGSDHYPILVNDRETTPTTTRRKRWRYEDADWESFENHFSNRIERDKRYSVEELSAIIIEAASKSIPRTSNKPGRRAVYWWCREVSDAVKKRRKALRKLRRLPLDHPDHPSVFEAFRNARNNCRKIILESKQKSWEEFLDGISEESDVTELWRRINTLSGKRRTRGMILTINDNLTDDPELIADEIGHYFASLSATNNYTENFKKRKAAKDQHPIIFPPDHDPPSPYNRPFSPEELNTALGTVRGKSEGPDEIGYPMLRRLPPTGKIILLETLNKLWENQNLPTHWKTATVIPIPKNGKSDKTPSDFRPISLISCMAKTMERMVNHRLVSFLEENQKIDHRQFAFRQGKGAGCYLGSLRETF